MHYKKQKKKLQGQAKRKESLEKKKLKKQYQKLNQH